MGVYDVFGNVSVKVATRAAFRICTRVACAELGHSSAVPDGSLLGVKYCCLVDASALWETVGAKYWHHMYRRIPVVYVDGRVVGWSTSLRCLLP